LSKPSRDKTIDGWRGISVLMVIIGHVCSYRLSLPIRSVHDVMGSPLDLAGNLALRMAASAGEVGVDFFFVISGYLITSLLIAEEKKFGSVSIKAFYTRRIFRILPAYLCYVATILVLRQIGWISVNHDSFARAMTYVCNFSEFKCSWWLAHTWSLSVEEQFYLCWPLLFAVFAFRRERALALIMAALLAGSWWTGLLGPFAHIAVGALVAVSARTRSILCRVASSPVILLAAALLVGEPLAYPVPVMAEAMLCLRPLLVAVVFFGTLLSRNGGVLRTLVANRPMAAVGLVSYSLYLWQQLSLAPNLWGDRLTGADRLYADHPWPTALMFVPIAMASYHLVERPFIRWGHRLSGRLMKRNLQQPPAPALGPTSAAATPAN